MAADPTNHPALIAKYLLKGYCLLNEYCPLGKNVPLVKSRDGTRICCCGDISCQYNEQAQLGGVAQPAAVSVVPPQPTVSIASVATSSPATQAWNVPAPVTTSVAT